MRVHPSTRNLVLARLEDSPLSPLDPLVILTMAASPPPTSTGSTKLDALVQKTAAQTPEKLSGLALYSRFAFAGAVCCSVTHGALTPVDV